MSHFIYIDETIENDRCVVRVEGKYFEKQKKYDDLLAHILKTMSNAILRSQQKNQHTVDMYVNLDNIKAKNLDLGFARDIIVMLQQLFPNRLNKCYIHNSPSFFRLFFENISIFIDKTTQSKIEFIKKNKNQKVSVNQT